MTVPEVFAYIFGAILDTVKAGWNAIVWAIWHKRWAGWMLIIVMFWLCLFMVVRSILAQ